MGENINARGPSTLPTLKWTFKMFAVLGYFPYEWSSWWKKILYNYYGIFLTLCLYHLGTSQMLDLILGANNQEEFTENLYITLVAVCDCCKTIMLLLCCKNILRLVESLEEEPFATMNEEETKIHTKFMERVERNSIIYTFIIELYLVWSWTISFLTDFRRGKLMCRAWIPYDYSSPFLFTVTYLHQVVGTVYGANFTIACDSLFSGLMVNIYCQFELLEYRLKNMDKHAYYSAKLCARHHRRIYEFATAVNKQFTAIISIQFMVDTLALCCNHYRLSLLEFGSKFIETVAFTVCLLVQILYYCWYGNEVKLKSLTIVDAALDSTTMSMDNNTRKMFLMIMMRAMEPIQFVSLHIISMNLESFISLLKTSYSVYTLLQQTK